MLGHRTKFNKSDDGIATQTWSRDSSALEFILSRSRSWSRDLKKVLTTTLVILTVVAAGKQHSPLLSCRLNTGSDCSDVTVSGREFHTREAATGKAPSPMVDSGIATVTRGPCFPFLRNPSTSPSLPFPSPSPPVPQPSPSPAANRPPNPARRSGERCKLPQRGLGRSPNRNRNRIWCILALKSVVGGNNFNDFPKSLA